MKFEGLPSSLRAVVEGGSRTNRGVVQDSVPDRDEEKFQEEAGHAQADGRRGSRQAAPQDVRAQLEAGRVDG